jgi:hypothetical protein
MKRLTFIIISLSSFACSNSRQLHLPERNKDAITGDEFYKNVFSASRVE